MSESHSYSVLAVYATDEEFGLDAKMEASIIEAAGHSSSSGCGFGERDHAWDNLSKAEAEAKALKLRAIPGLNVDVLDPLPYVRVSHDGILN